MTSLQNQGWISVNDKLPERGIRVWASSGKMDVGEDCYIGQKPCYFKDMTGDDKKDFGEVCWRHTFDSSEVDRPITHWMPLPKSPGHVEKYLFDPKLIRIDIEEVQELIRRKKEFNDIPFDKIVWYENGVEIKISEKHKDNWRFVGLSNIYFVEEEFWKVEFEDEDFL